MRIRPSVLVAAALCVFGAGAADAAARRPHARHHRGMDVRLVHPRPAPRAYYGELNERPDAPRYATRQRSWFQQGPRGSVNDSLEGLPPNVIDPPNVRSSGDRFR